MRQERTDCTQGTLSTLSVSRLHYGECFSPSLYGSVLGLRADTDDSSDVTPPLDEEEELEDSRQREAQARPELEADGCPPCYPPDIDIPMLRNPPEEYRAIVAYWMSFPGTSDMPLTAQLVAWRKFRTYQRQTRRRFQKFEDSLRQRRQRHGLDASVSLTEDLEQQSALDRWIEFQNYHLARLEALEEQRDGLTKELAEPCSDNERDAITYVLGTSERNIERHHVLLRWIEQNREAMVLRGAARQPSNEALDAAVRETSSSTRVLRTREKPASPVLDKRARISKPNKPQRRKTRHETQPEPKTDTKKSSAVIPPKASSERKPKRQSAKKPQETRYAKAPHQPGPQKEKTRHPQSHGLASVSEPGTVTRFGRRSKPPERWIPG